ncbi:MAG TPA: oxidoreductase [Lachnospiraceae bacterium]|nr:oxidoreductase [Lachnospiraceae bacterium]
MSELKICFIGIGSIAKRHMKNLDYICQKNQVDLSLDVCRSKYGASLEPPYKDLVHAVYYGTENLPEGYDVIFITNPTKYHFATLEAVAKKAKHFFIEKPVFDRTEVDWEKIRTAKGSICYVACPLRYSGVIQYLKSHVDFRHIYSIRSISSSYLPEWRKGVDYRETYSAHKESGGGVAIDLIHEWDYLTYLFGFPQKVYTLQGKYSELEIDSEDLAVYIAAYKDKCVELHLDYFGRETVRKIELIGRDDTIVGDLVANEIFFLKEGKKISFDEKRDDYQIRELVSFLAMVQGTEKNGNDIKKACEVLKLARGEFL